MNTHNNLIGFGSSSKTPLKSFRGTQLSLTSSGKRDSSSNSRSQTKQLSEAILKGDLETLKLFSKVSTSWKSWISKEYQLPLIFLIIKSNSIKLLEFAIEKGVNFNLKLPNTLETTLHFACKFNFCQMSKYLLEQGAMASVQDAQKLSPLHLAMKEECSECISLLFSYGANPKLRDQELYTPLHYGIKFGTGQALELLLQLGVDPQDEWINGYQPIHLAAQQGSFDDKDPLDLAIEKGSIESVRLLVEAGHPVTRLQTNYALESGKALVYSFLKNKYDERRRQNSHNNISVKYITQESLYDSIQRPSHNNQQEASHAQNVNYLNQNQNQVNPESYFTLSSNQNQQNQDLYNNMPNYMGRDSHFYESLANNQEQHINAINQTKVFDMSSIHTTQQNQPNNLKNTDSYDKNQYSGDSNSNQGMKFTIINNKQGEKVVGMSLEDGSTIYVNLQKLIRNQKTQKHSKNSILDQEFGDQSTNISHPQRISHFITQDPLAAVSTSQIRQEHLQIGKKIGSGAHAQVFKGTYMLTPVAIKQFKNNDQASFKAFLTEIDILTSIQPHPNILLFIGAFKQGPYSYIVSDYAKNGNLQQFIKKRKFENTNRRQSLQIDKNSEENNEINIKLKIKWALEVAQGLYYLHNQEPQILHRDIKAENILVFENLSVKICDFGQVIYNILNIFDRISKRIDQQMITGNKFEEFHLKISNQQAQDMNDKMQQTQTLGTVPWMAPEFLNDKIFTHKSDIYSYGIFLWEIFCEQEPYQELQPVQIMFQVVNNGLRPTIPKDIDEKVQVLIEACWQQNHVQRPELEQIIGHLKALKKLYKS
eukprot:403334830